MPPRKATVSLKAVFGDLQSIIQKSSNNIAHSSSSNSQSQNSNLNRALPAFAQHDETQALNSIQSASNQPDDDDVETVEPSSPELLRFEKEKQDSEVDDESDVATVSPPRSPIRSGVFSSPHEIPKRSVPLASSDVEKSSSPDMLDKNSRKRKSPLEKKNTRKSDVQKPRRKKVEILGTSESEEMDFRALLPNPKHSPGQVEEHISTEDTDFEIDLVSPIQRNAHSKSRVPKETVKSVGSVGSAKNTASLPSSSIPSEKAQNLPGTGETDNEDSDDIDSDEAEILDAIFS